MNLRSCDGKRKLALEFGCLLALASTTLASAQPLALSVRERSLFEIDLATGTELLLGEFLLEEPIDRFGDLAMAPDMALYAVGSAFMEPRLLMTLDPVTLESTLIGPLAPGLVPGGLTFDACGDLWLAATDHSDPGQPMTSLYSVDSATGETTPVVELPRWVDSLTARGTVLYGHSNASLVQIDPHTPAVETLGTIGSNHPVSVDFGAAGALWGLDNGRPIAPPVPAYSYTIDRATGNATEVATVIDGFQNVALAPPGGSCRGGQVPEIPTLDESGLAVLIVTLLLAGLAAIRRIV